MPSTNGHGLKTAVLWAIIYARVSTDEQARKRQLTRPAARGVESLRRSGRVRGPRGGSHQPRRPRWRDPGAARHGPGARPGGSRGRFRGACPGWDRIAREPVHHYLLRQRELEDYGCKIRELNDRGDDSPEGELTDGILDQLNTFERAKTTERTPEGGGKPPPGGRRPSAATRRLRFSLQRDAGRAAVEPRDVAVVEPRIFSLIGSTKEILRHGAHL